MHIGIYVVARTGRRRSACGLLKTDEQDINNKNIKSNETFNSKTILLILQ